MRKAHRHTAGLLAVLISSVSITSVTAVPANDAALIAAVREQWSQAVNGRQLDELVGLYVEGAVLMPQYVAPQLGLDAISAWYTTHFARIDALYEYSPESLRGEGPWAFETFTIRLTLAPFADAELAVPGDAVQTATRGTRVYRKDRAGMWRIDREIWDGLRPAGAFATSVLLRACTANAC